MRPTFSIIMPTCNRKFCIVGAIQSALGQTYPEFELVIVDDGSTDGTAEMVSSIYQKEISLGKIKLIRLDGHHGVCKARNAGIEAAKNQWIAYLDTDNFLMPYALGIYAHFINENPNQMNFYGQFQAMQSKKVFSTETLTIEKLRRQNYIDLGAYVHHRSLADSCGRFDETLTRLVDWDFIYRQCEKTMPMNVNRIVMSYNDSTSFSRISTTEDLLKNKKKILEKIEQSIPKKPLAQKKVEELAKAEPLLTLSSAQLIKKEKKNHPFFKIIIPNYNNQLYIKKCLDSIFSQTFQDFFVVLADDMSTDLSPDIAEVYQRKHSDQMKVIRMKEKKHAGGARNAGLDEETESKYIFFADSDDWLYSKNSLQSLYSDIVDNDFPDIIHCNAYFLKEKKIFSKNSYTLLCGTPWAAAPWQYCIKSELSYIKFKENRAKNNDNIWFLRLANEFETRKVIYHEDPWYIYNNISTTSCQNSAVKTQKTQIFATTAQLLNDINEEEATTRLAKIFKKNVIANRPRVCYAFLGSYNMPKQLNIDDVLSNSYAMSIDDNRYQRLSMLFKNAGLIVPQKVVGVQNTKLTPAQNCCQTHAKIISLAKEKNLPYVMIFEDDAYPRIDCKKEMQEYLNLVPEDADILIFGWIRHVPLKRGMTTDQKFDKPFNKVSVCDTQIWGAHAYVIFEKAYDKYLDYAKSHPQNEQPDGLMYNRFNSYVIDKPLFIQYNDSDKSLIHKTNSNYLFYGSSPFPPSGFELFEFITKTSSKGNAADRKMYNDLASSAIKCTDKIKLVMEYGYLMKTKTYCSDKIRVHDYCRNVLGKDICIPIIKTYASIDEIRIDELPTQFVLKANHGCGFNLIVKDKTEVSTNELRNAAYRWLNIDFSSRCHETHYRDIPRQIYAEQFMYDGHQDSLTDYKFLCFNGKPMYCQIINDRHNNRRRLNYYDMDFNFVDICRLEFPNNAKMLDKKPEKWNVMKDIAAKLSSRFDFVRVDLYQINGLVYLGEMTFTPGAGMIRYKDKQDDIKLGKLLNLAKI